MNKVELSAKKIKEIESYIHLNSGQEIKLKYYFKIDEFVGICFVYNKKQLQTMVLKKNKSQLFFKVVENIRNNGYNFSGN